MLIRWMVVPLWCLAAAFQGVAWAQTDAQSTDPKAALGRRIAQIEQDFEGSGRTFLADKKVCAQAVLVNRCVGDAVNRRRARETVLSDARVSAKEQLRQINVIAKNTDLAHLPLSPEAQEADTLSRREQLTAFDRRLKDAQERQEEHRRKKSLELENRRLYDEKIARAAEKQAEIRAKLKAEGSVLKSTQILPSRADLLGAPSLLSSPERQISN
jgi:hypothetical protein